MELKEGQLVRMTYMQEIDPNCELGIITTANNEFVILHWFDQNVTHKLSPNSFKDALDQGVYEVLGSNKK